MRDVDYVLARRAVLRDMRAGRRDRHDVCDAYSCLHRLLSPLHERKMIVPERCFDRLTGSWGRRAIGGGNELQIYED